MKKIIFATLCFTLVATFTSSAQKVSTATEGKRPWWATCIVDAAGALGGAGSVAGFLNVGSLTPVGWAAIGGGAILGGAGASLARNASGDMGIESPPIYVPNPNLPSNSTFMEGIEQTGIHHNQIIIDFYKIYPTFSIDNYWAFISENYKNYGIFKVPLSKVELEAIIKRANIDVTSIEELEKYLEIVVPQDYTSRTEFISTMKTLANSTSVLDLNSRAISIENALLASKNMTSKEKGLYEYFLAVFRASANLWNK